MIIVSLLYHAPELSSRAGVFTRGIPRYSVVCRSVHTNLVDLCSSEAMRAVSTPAYYYLPITTNPASSRWHPVKTPVCASCTTVLNSISAHDSLADADVCVNETWECIVDRRVSVLRVYCLTRILSASIGYLPRLAWVRTNHPMEPWLHCLTRSTSNSGTEVRRLRQPAVSVVHPKPTYRFRDIHM